MDDRWDPTSAAYALGIAEYEALLANAGERSPWSPVPTIAPLTRAESELPAATISELERASFRPVVRTRTIIPFGGGVVRVEFWVDPNGTTAVELSEEGTDDAAGTHFVSTYFVDGTAITVHQPGAALSESATRTLVQGSGELAHDLQLALDARAERIGQGGRALPLVDVETARLRDEVHGRFIAPKMFDFSANDDVIADIQKMFLRRDIKRIAVTAIVTAVFYAVTGWTGVLVIGGLVAAAQVYVASAFAAGSRKVPSDLEITPERFATLSKTFEEQSRDK